MKKLFKRGLALLLPIGLVAQVSWWIYNFINKTVIALLPSGMSYAWWYPFAFVIIVLFLIVVIGLIFSWIAPAKWMLKKVEHYIINKIPIVNKVYSFGKEISDSFIDDVKENGNLQVVQVEFGGQLCMGFLTDEKNNIVFVPTAPNPTNGFVFKTDKFIKINMPFSEALKYNASLGKISGDLFKL